jgi:hypothetical protein
LGIERPQLHAVGDGELVARRYAERWPE